MSLRVAAARRAVSALVATGCIAAAWATPIVPQSDAEVIERLPPALRLTASADPAIAVREARALLAASRRDGDPRPAGRALARLARWRDDTAAPAPIVIALADVEQYLHRFDDATRRLQALVAREPDQPQAWLMLATLHRVQGAYAASDGSCAALHRLSAEPYAAACTAENQALRGARTSARDALNRLLTATTDPATQAWLLTTLAELEQRARRPQAAEAAWRRALALADDGYARLGLADFLLDQQRPAEARALLQREPRNDGVLLRLAIAARRAGQSDAAALAAELRERFAQADLRPESGGHERERALALLDLDDQPVAALAMAQRNVERQREPLDLWLAARCARAASSATALADVRRLARQIDLHDDRLDIL